WSVAEMGHAFARGLASLSFLRVLLGLGEAGNWPGAAKVIAEWFPVRERALGMAIFNSGVTAGSIVAPPLVVWLQLHFGWQMTFLATGVLGFGWLVLWLLFYQPPERHSAITAGEYALIMQGREPAKSAPNVRWRELLKYRQVWAIVLSRFFTDPAWWLYITWLPLYLYSVRGFSLKQIGMFAWAPYVAAGAGSLSGGWFSGYLIGRGWSVNSARKAVILAGMLLMLAGIPAAKAGSAMEALVYIGIVMFGFQSWINNVQTLPSDFFPESAVASVAGLGGVGAGLGAILSTLATGFVVDRFHSYTPVLVTGALLPVLGTIVLFVIGGPIRRLPITGNRNAAITEVENKKP
ncbi:MAG: MFS transporter, partial [Acidobacteria bacterium]|nr:MFS transporter [Acidobacteriota bacterium]